MLGFKFDVIGISETKNGHLSTLMVLIFEGTNFHEFREFFADFAKLNTCEM